MKTVEERLATYKDIVAEIRKNVPQASVFDDVTIVDLYNREKMQNAKRAIWKFMSNGWVALEDKEEEKEEEKE